MDHSKTLQGYELLTDSERKVFVRAHRKHLSNIEPEQRPNYTLDKVWQLSANKQENGVNVIFSNGEAYLYKSKGVFH